MPLLMTTHNIKSIHVKGARMMNKNIIFILFILFSVLHAYIRRPCIESNWLMIDKRLRRSRADHDKEMASGPIKYTKRPKKKAWCNIIQWHGQLVGHCKSSAPAPCVVGLSLSLSLPCLFISDTKNSSHVDELMGCGAHGKWHHNACTAMVGTSTDESYFELPQRPSHEVPWGGVSPCCLGYVTWVSCVCLWMLWRGMGGISFV